MMKQRIVPIWLPVLLALLALLSACGQAQPSAGEEPTAAPTEEAAASPTPEPTAAPTPEPTEEPAVPLELYGMEFSSLDTMMDIRYTPISDGGAELRTVLDQMPHLEKVDMCGCGLSNDEMEALTKEYPDIKFVWEIQVGTHTLRTDIKGFCASMTGDSPDGSGDREYSLLRYCTDMVALDLGHTPSKDISYITNMPHLRYLVIADTYVSDLTPLTQLPELEYLEMFLTQVRDMSPLLECKNLRDLNCSCCYRTPRENAYNTLIQMTWLERLWYCDPMLTPDQQEEIRYALPEGSQVIYFKGVSSTGLDWRYNDRYYAMRDYMDMRYM